jgi:hypothetical protein
MEKRKEGQKVLGSIHGVVSSPKIEAGQFAEESSSLVEGFYEGLNTVDRPAG